ncbi:hypothetical protein Tco_0592497 [Tanacetum coccineum]
MSCTTLSKKVEDLHNDLQQTKKVYSSALTKLVLRVKKLEKQVKTSKARRRVRLVLLEDEDAEDAEIQEKISDNTDVLIEEEEPTEIVEDHDSGEKEKRKDKGKAIMREDESVQKKKKKGEVAMEIDLWLLIPYEMLDDFDRQDVEERYTTSRLEGYDLMLWGDLNILFQPDEEDEVWRNQHEYNLIS